MSIPLLCLLLLRATAADTPLQPTAPSQWDGQVVGYDDFGKPGETRFFPGPKRKFGVVVFCDDALGTTIGVVSTALSESGDLEKGWRQHRRFWQEKAWCLNVTSFGWSPDGRYLMVGTCDIYGTGYLYQLDLHQRRKAVLFPRTHDESLVEHCWSTEIDAVGSGSVTFHMRDYCDEDKIFLRKTVPFLGADTFESLLPDDSRSREDGDNGAGK